MAFFERVRQGYLTRAANNPNRFVVIDASKSLDVVQAQIGGKLAPILGFKQ
jgi:dTMP kinase